MIVNLWNKIQLYCANHAPDENGKLPHMTPHDAASSNISKSLYGNAGSMNMFYSCPKYYPENRNEGEPCCRNHISMKEFEKMLEHISGIIEKNQEADVVCDLTGLKWKSKAGVEYVVTRYSDQRINITCLNSKSLWK